MANCTETPSPVTSNAEGTMVSPAMFRPQRQKSLKSQILSPQDIAKEILERSQRKHPQRLPEGGDVIFTMKLTQRLAKRVVGAETSPAAPDLDARKLLSILQDGAETHYLEKPKPIKQNRFRPEPKLDPELEKRLALKQLMEFSRKRGRPRREEEDNNNETKKVTSTPSIPTSTPKTARPETNTPRKAESRELQALLQDEGAINMLYSIEKGDSGKEDGLLPSKRRMKKALVRKAQEVKEALLGGVSGGLNLRHRTSPPSRKPSLDSLGSDQSGGHPTPPEASRIIRRHSSSSSFSAGDSPPSSPIPNGGLKERLQTGLAVKLASAPSSRSDTWKMLQEDWNVDDPSPPDTEPKGNVKQEKSAEAAAIQEVDTGWRRLVGVQHCKEVRLRRAERLLHAEICPTSTHLPHALNSQVLKELCWILEEVGRDPDIGALLLTYADGRCQGLDLPALVHQDPEDRKAAATQLSNSIKDFVGKLCMMKKAVIGGVTGEIVGIGVVMLAYMDLVVAGSQASFATPYATLGHAPEAAATLTLPKTIGLPWSRRLLLGGITMNAEDAERSGLVSWVVPHEDFSTRLMESALKLANQCNQGIESSKAMMLHDIRNRLGWVLSLETSLLQHHWSTDECQERIRTYLHHPPL